MSIKKNNSEIINIAMSADENYIIQTCVAVISCLENKRIDTHYKFYFVLSAHVEKCIYSYLAKIKKLYADFEFEIVSFNLEKEIDDIYKYQTIKRISETTYYRLFYNKVLNIDKCIYLDSDIIVFNDLSEIYNIEIENFYVAGCSDFFAEKNSLAIGLNSSHLYINAGVLLMNLNAINSDNLDNKFIEHIKKGYPLQDQDVLNIVCYPKIRKMPLKYNCSYMFFLSDTETRKFNEIGSLSKISIFHFAGDEKPWINYKNKFSQIWFDYAHKILNESEYKKIVDTSINYTKKCSYKNLLKEIRSETPTVLWGTNENCKKRIDRLIKHNINIVTMTDNKINLEENDYEGICIEKFTVILKKYCCPQYIILASSKSNQINITEQLEKEGVSKEQIFYFPQKNIAYYGLLDEKYFEEELRDIFYFEYRDKYADYTYDQLLEIVNTDWNDEMKNFYFIKYWVGR